MSTYGNNFTKVVNSDVQTTSILNGVAGALSAISSYPGFTGFTTISPTGVDIVLDTNTLNAISASKTILLDGTGLTAQRKLVLGLDTELNAKSLIKTFGLDSNPNPKLIKTVKVGTAANTAYGIYLGTTGGTTFKYVSVKSGATGAASQEISVASATKGGYLSVQLGAAANTIVFDVVTEQTA